MSATLRSYPVRLWLRRIDTALLLIWATNMGRAQSPDPIWTVREVRQVAQAAYLNAIVDTNGDVYVSGSAISFDWTEPSHSLGDQNAQGAYVAKLNASGHPIYTTFIAGGPGTIYLDHAGALYLTGRADATTFTTTPGAFHGSANSFGNDAICKLNTTDGSIQFCAMLDSDAAGAFAVDGAGFLYLAGTPYSRYLEPTEGAVNLGKRSIYVTKLDPTATKLIYRAEFSGSMYLDGAANIAPAEDGSLWLAGGAANWDYPTTPDAVMPTVPKPEGSAIGQFGFLTHLNSSGSELLYSSFTGVNESVADFVRDSRGNLHLAVERRGDAAFLRGFDATGRSQRYEHRFPADTWNHADGRILATDSDDSILALGETWNVNFPVYRSGEACQLATYQQDRFEGALIRVDPQGQLQQTSFVETYRWTTSFSVKDHRLFLIRNRYPAFFVPDPSGSAGIGTLERVEIAADPSAQPVKLACIGNAATLAGGMLSHGEIVSIFGSGFGPTTPVSAKPSNGRFPTQISGVGVTFDGVPAPLLYVSENQINAVVPWTTLSSIGPKICVEFAGTQTNCLFAGLVEFTPGLFQWGQNTTWTRPYAAVVNQDGSINSPDRPACLNSVISLYATGLGWLYPVPEDGAVLTGDLPRIANSVRVVFIGDRGVAGEGEVLYAGPAPQQVAGLFQINVRVPDFWILGVPQASVTFSLPIEGDREYYSQFASVALIGNWDPTGGPHSGPVQRPGPPVCPESTTKP